VDHILEEIEDAVASSSDSQQLVTLLQVKLIFTPFK
jgi:hypothetical protein